MVTPSDGEGEITTLIIFEGEAAVSLRVLKCLQIFMVYFPSTEVKKYANGESDFCF